MMAFSVLRTSARFTKTLFDNQTVLQGFSNGVKHHEFQRNLFKACAFQFLETSPRHQKSSKILSVSTVKNYGKKAKPQYSSESESDSDLDEPGHRGESEFWRRKIRTFHSIIDINKDGVISFHDFELLIERFVALGNLSEKDTQDFRQLVKEWWEKRWGEITPYNFVTVEKYLEYMHHVLNDRQLVRKAHTFIPYIFRAVDKDKSGSITFEEYKLFFECLGLEERDAILAFRAIDSNGDGVITLKEFVKHGRDFFVTEDENRISKYFWGPLLK